MPVYSLEERARARQTVRRLEELSEQSKASQMRGLLLPPEAQRVIVQLTGTEDVAKHVDQLAILSERMRDTHLAKLKPLAKDNFNAFCEYVNPDEPPESKWHIWLTNQLEKVETDPSYSRFVLNCPPGHAKPLAGDTLVLMANGVRKRLDAIEVGEYVISHTGQPRKILQVHKQGRRQVLKVQTVQGREIVAALDHPFLTNPVKMIYKNARDLKPGDAVHFGVPAAHTNTSGKNLTEFELAAYFSTHGGRTYCLDRSKTRTYRNIYLTTRDDALFEDMKGTLDILGYEYKSWFATHEAVNMIRLKTSVGDAICAAYGLEEHAHDKRIPEFVQRGGEEEIKHYLSMVISLRGGAPTRFKFPRLIVTFKSRALARDIQSLLSRFGVASTVSDTCDTSAKLTLKPADLEAYFAAGMWFDHPQNENLQARRAANPHESGGPSDEIYGAWRAGIRECYCLTVEEDHSFIANDIVVKNSTYASRLYVAWRMGRRPRDKIIGGGHSQTFVENEFSKRIRAIVGSPSYRDVFPEVSIAADARAAAQWVLAGTGGQYVAKGAGQAVHGFRANFICVDDPYPNIETAESAVMREKVRSWFFVDLGSRLLPNSTVFLIMTRFHEDDLTGEVIKVNPSLAPSHRYKIIDAPAICYDPETDVLNRSTGDVLWDYYNHAHFMSFKATWSYQRFALVFQQLPSATADDSIASKLKFYKRAPHETEDAIRAAKENNQIDPSTGRVQVNKRDYYRRIVASVDCAAKKTERADYTVIQIWGEDQNRHHFLLDQVRIKAEMNEMITAIERTARRHNVDAILVEDKGQGTAYLQARGSTAYQKRQAPAPLVAIQVPSNQGKEFRFDEIAPMIEAGEVHIPENGDFTDLFVREVGQFPGGAHDDQVDSMSQYLRWAKSKRTRYGSKKVGSMG